MRQSNMYTRRQYLEIKIDDWKKVKLTQKQEEVLDRRRKSGYIITRSWRTKYAKWVRVDILNIKTGATKSLYWHNNMWQIAH